MFLKFYFFKKNYFFIFLNFFNMLMLKIFLKKYKKNYFNIFLNKKFFQLSPLLQSQTSRYFKNMAVLGLGVPGICKD
jgi:hypothetical protein